MDIKTTVNPSGQENKTNEKNTTEKTNKQEMKESKAVIGGLACRLPKSQHCQEYWQNLVNGVDMIGPTRWPERLYDLPPRIGAILEEDKFDNDFFNIPDDEANNLNPMLRHLLEVVHECVVDSCVPLTTLQHATTGLYLATFCSDYDFIETSRCANTDHVSLSPFLAGEVVRSLGIKGPSVTVDTACSSSLSALNMAVNAIVAGRCTYAIIASCNLILNPMYSQQMFLLHMLCKEGKSRVFDKNAAGYVRAEGFGALLISGNPSLFPRVYANIRGIGVNCDGYKPQGITYPNSETQAKLMKRVYKRAGIDVCDVKYVETHGTGTQAGDAMETKSVEKVFCENRTEPLLIGSVKSNIGHTEATAGLASIIKAIMCLRHGEIPGNLNYREPNPAITGITEGRLKVVDKNTPLNGCYIGVNSFGFGGVNGHVILEPYRDTENKEEFVHVPGNLLVPLTVRNQEGVEAMVEFVSNNRYNSSLLSVLTQSLLSCDQRQPIRGYIQIGPKEHDFVVCSEPWEEDLHPIYLCLDFLLSSKIKVALDLLENDTFMIGLKDCSRSIKKVYPSFDVVSLLMKGEPMLPCTRDGILAASTLIITLFDWLEKAGVVFDGMVACGLTEVIGAYLDGCLGLDQCFCIMDLLGQELEKFSQEMGERWVLYDVRLDVENVYQLGPWVQVLSVHDSDHVTISVEAKHKEELLTKIHTKGGVFNRLPCNVPLYSDYMMVQSHKLKKQIRDIIPDPRYWSTHFISCRHGWDARGKDMRPVLCDADYISKLVCNPVNVYAATKHLPANKLLLTMIPTVSQGLQIKLNSNSTGASHSFSAILEASKIVLQHKDSDHKPGLKSRGLSQSGLNNQSIVDESLSEDSYNCKRSNVDLHCLMTSKSLCHVLGQLHMLGHQLDLSMLYPTRNQPLGIDTPSFSPLVTWDHGEQWDMPHWMEFSCRIKDEKFLYKIQDRSLDDDSSPMAIMLFEVWQAISYKLIHEGYSKIEPTDDYLLPAVKLYDLVVGEESILSVDSLCGASIPVLPGTERFAVISDDDVLLSGRFKVDETLPLPSIHGYDLDINENISTSPGDREAQCEKTDMKWEDDWEDFINECLEFSNLYLEPPLLEFTLDSGYHLREAKKCPAFLAVLEKSSGICRSGGCVFKFDLTLTPQVPEVSVGQDLVVNPEKTSVSKLLVYSLSGNQAREDRVIVCQAEKETEGKTVPILGIININGEKLMREVPFPGQWQTEDLEMVVPYLLASHILYDIAHIEEHHRLLVLPPIDSVGVYILALASKLGCSVFTSTYDVESLQTLESMFPFIRVIQGGRLYEDIMAMTQGEGVNVCIRESGGEINTALRYLSKNGHLIQGMTPPKGTSDNISMIGRSNRISVLRPLMAVSAVMDRTDDDVEVLLIDMKDEAISQLTMEGFPEQKGILYNQENASNFLQPIALDRLISLVMEPSLGGAVEDLMEADILCVEKIQSLVAPKPKDFSVADISCAMKTTGSVMSKASPEITLDLGMMITPDVRGQKRCEIELLSPDIHIISFMDEDMSRLSPGEKGKAQTQSSEQYTSTPVMKLLAMSSGDKPLEESYIDPAQDHLKATDTPKSQKITGKKSEPVMKLVTSSRKPEKSSRESKVNPPAIILTDLDNKSKRLEEKATPSPVPSRGLSKKTPGAIEGTFQHLMQHKSKLIPPQLHLAKPRVDLLKINPPMTPMTPALKEILTPVMESNLVPLNSLSDQEETALYIVHPVTGITRLLEALGEQLKIPCFGIKRTGTTPTDSISSVASFYRNAITLRQPKGPYKICGYSFGSLIALEIALQLQAAGHKVDRLLFLDGSPMYIQSQIAFGLKHLPSFATGAQIEEALECGALINWMKMYGMSQNLFATYGLLRKLPTFETKVETAVDLTFGNSIVSSNPSKTKWLTAREKLLKHPTAEEKKVHFADAAKELMWHMRKERATVFVHHTRMASTYEPSGKFDGDIYLHRVKGAPIFAAVELPEDYGLEKLCLGKVCIKFYEGEHESFLGKQCLPPLVRNLNQLLIGK